MNVLLFKYNLTEMFALKQTIACIISFNEHAVKSPDFNFKIACYA